MYDVILADPPWLYRQAQGNDPARGGITYPVLSSKDLYELPVHRIANKDSMLVMWVTFPKLVDEEYSPLDIMRGWGFTPITALFVWVKTNAVSEGFYSGLGYYTNSNAEVAFVGKRGKGLPRIDKSVKQLLFAPLGKHSEKPAEQYARIHRLWGNDIKCIELFARKQNPPPSHWAATGLDFDGTDIRTFLHKE